MTSKSRLLRAAAVCTAVTILLTAACGKDTTATSVTTSTTSPGPRVAFVSPSNGATVDSPVTVALTASEFTIEPAGEVHPNAGHLHVMIDVGCVATGIAIPKDDAHVHLGQGQLSTELLLTPGSHRLCLQAADGAHMALPLTDEITITVSA